MKIKGVYKDKKRKGEPIEYEPAEKVPLAVMDGLIKEAPKGEVWYAEGGPKAISLDETKFQFTPRELKSKKKFANNAYKAEGKVKLRVLDKKDKLRPVKEKTFKIEFCDCLDSWGQPELKITKFVLQ